MASITPSSVFALSMGSLGAKIARFEDTTVDSGDYWSSNITNIVAIFPMRMHAGSTASTTGISASFTATDGTIFMFPASENSEVDLLVLYGSGNAEV